MALQTLESMYVYHTHACMLPGIMHIHTLHYTKKTTIIFYSKCQDPSQLASSVRTSVLTHKVIIFLYGVPKWCTLTLETYYIGSGMLGV